MILRLCAALLTTCCLACRWLARGCVSARQLDDRGQTTAEYALVIVGAATVAVLLVAWATGSGKIAWLLDKMVDTVAGMVQ